MKERPILFNCGMVRAILAGHKTQTRRVVKRTAICTDKDTYGDDPNIYWHGDFGTRTPAPFGNAGDRLWVREAWKVEQYFDLLKPSEIPFGAAVQYAATDHLFVGKRRPSIFMPRWASRITLEINNVRIEPLQAISRGDAMAEGCPFPNLNGPEVGKTDPVEWFRNLWDSINEKGGYGWHSNPLVWVVEFKLGVS
jgi:hypothetical protein